MCLHGLIAHFFLMLRDSLLFRYTTLYLSIHLPKDILVASKFWQYISGFRFLYESILLIISVYFVAFLFLLFSLLSFVFCWFLGSFMLWYTFYFLYCIFCRYLLRGYFSFHTGLPTLIQYEWVQQMPQIFLLLSLATTLDIEYPRWCSFLTVL